MPESEINPFIKLLHQWKKDQNRECTRRGYVPPLPKAATSQKPPVLVDPTRSDPVLIGTTKPAVPAKSTVPALNDERRE